MGWLNSKTYALRFQKTQQFRSQRLLQYQVLNNINLKILKQNSQNDTKLNKRKPDIKRE